MRAYCTNKTEFIEFFLKNKSESNYADYIGANDEITVFRSEDTNEIVGYAIEDIGDLSLIDISMEDKLAIIVKRLRVKNEMTQKDFVDYLNNKAGANFISFRNYQRIESADNSGSIGMSFLSTLIRLFPKENWLILLPNEERTGT